MPDYYLKPFHSYKEGNLCWEAAIEVSRIAILPPFLMRITRLTTGFMSFFRQVLFPHGVVD